MSCRTVKANIIELKHLSYHSTFSTFSSGYTVYEVNSVLLITKLQLNMSRNGHLMKNKEKFLSFATILFKS